MLDTMVSHFVVSIQKSSQYVYVGGGGAELVFLLSMVAELGVYWSRFRNSHARTYRRPRRSACYLVDDVQNLSLRSLSVATYIQILRVV